MTELQKYMQQEFSRCKEIHNTLENEADQQHAEQQTDCTLDSIMAGSRFGKNTETPAATLARDHASAMLISDALQLLVAKVMRLTDAVERVADTLEKRVE